MMHSCAWCGQLVVAGGVEQNGKRYCSANCARLSTAPSQLCPDCIATTTDKSTGNLGRLNGIGVALIRKGSVPPCPKCQSVVSRTWFTFLYIPLIPMGTYRVLYRVQQRLAGRSTFFARKLKRAEAKPAQSAAAG